MALSEPVDLYAFDKLEAGTHGLVLVGLDEAGRGPLAGSVVAAAVVLDYQNPIAGINDSKKLSAKRRDVLYDQILNKAVAWAVGEASVEEIASLNILNASLTAMQRALDKINCVWNTALVDGNCLIKSLDAHRQKTVVGGDAKSACIAAASIIAKVTRDRQMEELHVRYPVYGFDKHKGYGTALHCAMLKEHAVSPVHRLQFCEGILNS